MYRPKQNKQEIIYGRHPVMEALQSGKGLERIFIQKGLKGEYFAEISKICREKEIPVSLVPNIKLQNLTSQNHQGIVAILAVVEYYEVQHILDHVFANSESPFLIMLDGVTDVRNFGAIARSAYGLGAHAIIIPKQGSAQINSEALKTSAGALNHLPVCRVNNLVACARDMKLNGIQMIGLDIKAERFIGSMDADVPLCLVMGAEDIGISPALQKEIDENYKIPIENDLDSFNVSVAAALVMYEVLKKRKGS